MFDSGCSLWTNARICFSVGVALFAILPQLCYAATSSGTFEIDLIFPRNDTYAPVTLFPIVFAAQNPPLAGPLGAYISWSLWESGNRDGPNSTSSAIDLKWVNASASNPYLATDWTRIFIGLEGTWVLSWSLSVGNCSESGDGFRGVNENKYIIFTIDNNAPQPDLVAATSSNTCAATESFTFDVTDVKPAPAQLVQQQPSCAVLATGPAPTANPCAVSINASAASSVAAAMTSSACIYASEPNFTLPNVTCPPSPFDKPSVASGEYFKRSSTWLLLIICGLSALMHL